jgi:diacylglycerol kinase (ATP)
MIKKRLLGFRYAFRGIALLFATQANARIHLAAAFTVFAAGLFFQVSRTEWILLALSICLVLMAEALNTALEFLTDLVSPGYHELAGKAKDTAAGAVLICALGAAGVGIAIFAPRLLALLDGP